jgi:hypothetical protein
MNEVTPGVQALLGRLKVCVVGSAATFELTPGHPTVSGAGAHPTVAEIGPPEATVGRGDKADLRLVGPASKGVSRVHLLVQPAGRQWTVTDCQSSNGTYEEDSDSGGWRPVPADFPVPVAPELLLCLDEDLLLRFELGPLAADGQTTAKKGVGPRARMQRIHPPELERAAAAILAPRRANPRDGRTPSVAELASVLSVSEQTVYRRLAALRELDEIPTLMEGHAPDLAAALELAFPYLLAPSPLN